MTTFVLVHGSMHRGWCWTKVARLLRGAGHEVSTPTLTGLGERVHTRGLIALCLVGLLSLSGLAQAAARQADPAPRYAVTDLGEIKDYSNTTASALNAKGMVVGLAYEPYTYLGRATVYRGGRLRALIKGETGFSAAQDVNAAGQIVGYAHADDLSPSRAMLWESNGGTDLGDLGGGRSAANAINDVGVVVGESASTAGGDHPFVWVDGEMTALALLPEGELGGAFDINADGLVVGYSNLGPFDPNVWTPQRAVAWDEGELIDLGTIAGDHSLAFGVNAEGQIVGWSTTTEVQTPSEADLHAVLWDGEEITDLGTLADGKVSSATAINTRGEIVGHSTIRSGESGGSHAFLWRDGELLDVNDLVEGGSGVVLGYAWDINDKGLIVATGYTANGFEHAFLLTPIED